MSKMIDNFREIGSGLSQFDDDDFLYKDRNQYRMVDMLMQLLRTNYDVGNVEEQ